MSIVPISWSEFYRTAQNCRYQHPRALKDQIEALKPACTDLSPFVYRDPSVGALLLAKGKMLNPTSDGKPAVYFAITLKPQFPNAYPILSIEQPPAGWRITNHPNVDREGLCYLSAVTNWNPRSSSIFMTCAELQQVLTDRHPYERGPAASMPTAPQAQPHPAPQQHQPQSASRATQQQPQQQQQQRPMQSQPSSAQGQQRSGAQTVAGGAGLALSIMGALLSAGANSSNTRTTTTTSSDGRSVPVLNPGAEQQAREQRERDRAWLQQQQQQRGAQHQIQRRENEAAMEFAKEQFIAVLQGTTRVAPGSEINTPPTFGLAGKVTTHPQGISGPLVLSRKAAPRPLPAVTEPTPDEQYHQQQAEAARAHQQQEEAQTRAPPPAGAFGLGMRALSRGVGALSKAATSAKHTVEDRVRANSITSESQRFQTLFPDVPHAQEPMVTNYHCKLICGDGVARGGYLFMTHRCLYFSSKTLPGDGSATPPPAGAGGVVVQTVVPFSTIVTLALGDAVNSKCLHVVGQDNSCRSFTDFHSNKMIELGSYVSSAVKGSALDRCYNWVDHLWRAAVPAVPVPGYPYEQPLAPNGGVPPAAGSSQITGGSAGLEIPTPGPMYGGGSAAAAAPAPGPAAAPAPASQITSALPAPNSEAEDKEDAMTCAICLDQPKNCFLRPCGHVAACMGCARQLQSCPICRAPITDRFQAFL